MSKETQTKVAMLREKLENLTGKQISLTESPLVVKNIPVKAKLEYDASDDSWWIALFPEGSRMAVGSADNYKIPTELRQSMNLDSLIPETDGLARRSEELY